MYKSDLLLAVGWKADGSEARLMRPKITLNRRQVKNLWEVLGRERRLWRRDGTLEKTCKKNRLTRTTF